MKLPAPKPSHPFTHVKLVKLDMVTAQPFLVDLLLDSTVAVEVVDVAVAVFHKLVPPDLPVPMVCPVMMELLVKLVTTDKMDLLLLFNLNVTGASTVLPDLQVNPVVLDVRVLLDTLVLLVVLLMVVDVDLLVSNVITSNLY